jgi:hypothetical protein
MEFIEALVGVVAEVARLIGLPYLDGSKTPGFFSVFLLATVQPSLFDMTGPPLFEDLPDCEYMSSLSIKVPVRELVL